MVSLTVKVEGLEKLMNSINDPVMRQRVIANVLNQIRLLVQRKAMEHAPVRTGNLRRTISSTLDSKLLIARVGSHAKYACVFDAQTQVVTENGPRLLGQIRTGDRVLTQAGDFQDVLAVSKFPAALKPELVTITVPWRKNSPEHSLTVTADHKILVFREGRNKWVKAGDLLDTDSLFVRRKLAHNKDTGLLKICVNCGGQFRNQSPAGTQIGQGKKYCSQDCRDQHWAAGANPHLGMKRSALTRERLSAASSSRHSGQHLNRILGGRGFQTAVDRKVELWLQQRGVQYLAQAAIGHRSVDFYLPDSNEIIEADGAFWHRDQQKDIRRDQELLDACPGVKITHIHFWEERFSPVVDPNPLPQVNYVVCNPDVTSFADPTQFELKNISSLKHWTYVQTGTPAMLYDLTVRGVHSFTASSIVVSNSYVESGTGLYGPLGRRITAPGGGMMRFRTYDGFWPGATGIKGDRRLTGTTRSGATDSPFVYTSSTAGMRPRPWLLPAWQESQPMIHDILAAAGTQVAATLAGQHVPPRISS